MSAAASARDSDRIAGRYVFLPVRYADDFVVLVSGTLEEAMAEKSALADYLIETTGLTLSPEKTKVTAMTEGFEFLGFRFSAHWDKRYGYGPRVEIPKAKAANLRHKVKQLTERDSISVSLGEKLRKVNSITSGWANYYRYCVGAGRVFVDLDWYIGLRLYCWLQETPKRLPQANCGAPNSLADAGQRDESGEKDPSSNMCSAGHLSSDTVSRGWTCLTLPCLLESRMRNERRMSGSARGDARPAAVMR
ncbi:group II intron maturase-specific domain-containing protein [Rhizobium beringeri]